MSSRFAVRITRQAISPLQFDQYQKWSRRRLAYRLAIKILSNNGFFAFEVIPLSAFSVSPLFFGTLH